MKIERNMKITELNHDDLVDLFSTALTGSFYLSVEYDRDFYRNLPDEKKDGDCIEDKIADTLLNGGTIFMYDNDSDGEIYGEGVAEVINEGYDYTQYTLNLQDIIKGLENAANLKYKQNNDDQFVLESFQAFENDRIDFDYTYADCLMQVIMFNEVIYG